jgi:hypothetical protein
MFYIIFLTFSTIVYSFFCTIRPIHQALGSTQWKILMKKNGRKRTHQNLESFLYQEERIPRFDLSSKPFSIRVESVLNRPSIIGIVPFSFSFGMVKKAFHQNKITFYGIPCKRSLRTVSSNLWTRSSQPKNHSWREKNAFFTIL